MYEVSIHEGNSCILNKADFRYTEKIAQFLKVLKWNDSLEICIYWEGELKHYIKYEEELHMAIELYQNY